jgi:endonuclease YncB( thermonuclease family)
MLIGARQLPKSALPLLKRQMIRKVLAVCGLLLGLTCLSSSAELTDNIELDISTGYLYSGHQPFRLYGIQVIDRDNQCIANGLNWECGIAAQQALLNHIEEESLVCGLMPPIDHSDANTLVAECFVGALSVNAQLVEDGWALTAADIPAPYRKEALLAQRKKEGIFRGGFVPPNNWRPKSEAQLGDCGVCTARHQSLIRNREKRKAQLESDNNQ